MQLRDDANKIIQASVQAVLPDEAVSNALKMAHFGKGKIYLVATGKAAWQMAHAATQIMNNRIEAGVVITKYDHVQGDIPKVTCFEAGHPVPDENSFLGTEAALQLVENLTAEDTVLFLLSGGGSALFEKPLIPAEELADITKQLLACGADIIEMNTIRKRLSAVKGGRFAVSCAPAKVFSIVLSDILGDPLDMIASGPACPDTSTCELALSAAEGISNLKDTAVFSLGSDGTDGPTDAAGGYCDNTTKDLLKNHGISIYDTLKNNDAYTALKEIDGLIMTGATGTNVNDVSVLLIRR